MHRDLHLHLRHLADALIQNEMYRHREFGKRPIREKKNGITKQVFKTQVEAEGEYRVLGKQRELYYNNWWSKTTRGAV